MNDYTTEKFTEELKLKLSGCFDCGNPALTAFLKSYEALDDFFGKTYVMVDIENQRIIGYYNISTGHIEDETGVRYNVFRVNRNIYHNYIISRFFVNVNVKPTIFNCNY